MKKIICLLICGLSLVFGAHFETEPQNIMAGEPFVFSLVVEQRELPRSYSFPEMQYPKNFQLLKTDTLSEVRRGFMFNRVAVKKFRFHFLVKQSGNYELGPITWQFNGMKQNLQKTQIVIQPSYDEAALWVSGRLNKTNPYEGEQVRYDLSFGIKMNYQSGPIPLFTGFGESFWGEYSEEKMEWERQKSGSYVATAKRKAYLAPIRSGALTLPKMAYKYTKVGKPERVVEEKKMGNSYFRTETVQQKPVEDTAYAPAIQLQVKPLPLQNQPEFFKGLVGEYQMEVNYDKDSLKVGEALVLSVVLKGNGRPGYMPDPELPDLAEFRVVPPESKIRTQIKGGLQETIRELKYYLYPRRQMNLQIAPLRLAYFDPKRSKYEVLEAGAHGLIVSKGEGVELAIEKTLDAGSQSSQKAEPPLVLRPIHANAKLGVAVKPLYKTTWFWSLWALALTLFFSSFWIAAKIKAHLADRIGARKRRAKRNRQERLSQAGEVLKGGDAQGYYQKLEEAMLCYFSDLYNLEFHGRTRVQLLEFLQEQKWSEKNIEILLQWLDEFERRRFSGMRTELKAEDLTQIENWLMEFGA